MTAVWLAIAFLAAVAAVLAVARRPLAAMQAAVMGGRIGPGCVVAQAVVVLLAALAIFLLRNHF
jgi:hypothetical protein